MAKPSSKRCNQSARKTASSQPKRCGKKLQDRDEAAGTLLQRMAQLDQFVNSSARAPVEKKSHSKLIPRIKGWMAQGI
jgi:hypothetical protein